MKVLIAPAHYLLSDKYGSEPLWAYEIVKHLAAHFDRLDVICGVVDIQNPLPKNVNIVPMYVNRSGNVYFEFLKRVLFYPLVFWSFIKLNYKNHYTVVHHLFPLSIATLNPIVFFAKFFGVKKIVLGPLQLPQTSFSKKDLKMVLVGNSKSDWSGYVLLPVYLLILLVVKPLSQLMFRVSDTVICNSTITENYYKTHVKLRNTVVIPTGITLQKKVQHKAIGDIRILCVGHLTKRKGQDLLFQAFYELLQKYPEKKLHLTLVGNGELKEELKDFITLKKIKKHVDLYPTVVHEKIWDFYSSHNVYCLPSRSDPSPTVILEAMMYGLAIVASDVGAVSDMVGDSGIIVESNSVESLKKGLCKLFTNPSINRLGHKARSRIVNVYNWDQIVNKYIHIYEK